MWKFKEAYKRVKSFFWNDSPDITIIRTHPLKLNSPPKHFKIEGALISSDDNHGRGRKIGKMNNGKAHHITIPSFLANELGETRRFAVHLLQTDRMNLLFEEIKETKRES